MMSFILPFLVVFFHEYWCKQPANEQGFKYWVGRSESAEILADNAEVVASHVNLYVLWDHKVVLNTGDVAYFGKNAAEFCDARKLACTAEFSLVHTYQTYMPRDKVSCGVMQYYLFVKPGFHYPSWQVTGCGFHYRSTRAVLTGARFPLAVLTSRQHG